MVEVDERISCPQSLMDLFARHQLPGMFQEHDENFEGLIGKTDAGAVAAEFARAQVCLVRSEADEFNGNRRRSHGAPQQGSEFIRFPAIGKGFRKAFL